MLDQIKHEKLENKINLIILSDHGMESVTYDKMIFLDEYVSNKTYKLITTGPNAFILPDSSKSQETVNALKIGSTKFYFLDKYNEIYKNLTQGASATKKFKVYKKDQLLDRWYMKNTNRLTGLLYLLAEPGYAFWNEYFDEILAKTSKDSPHTTNLRSIFIRRNINL